MSLSLSYLLDRMKHPRTRADELARLRARFAAHPGQRQAGRRATGLARELRELRRAASVAFGSPVACARCARGHPLPAGRWDGGHCCGGRTLDIFSPLEAAMLKVGGTSTRRLRAPSGEHAGCAFRTARGCCLDPADRPTICLRHVCGELRQELLGSRRWARLMVLRRRLGELSREFADVVGLAQDAAGSPFEPTVACNPSETTRGVAPASSGASRAVRTLPAGCRAASRT